MSAHATKFQNIEEEPTVIGGTSVVARFLKTPKRNAAVPGDPLASHIHRLLQLHPAVALKFRDVNLSTMDNSTKQSLLEDINSVLGIKPLNTSR